MEWISLVRLALLRGVRRPCQVRRPSGTLIRARILCSLSQIGRRIQHSWCRASRQTSLCTRCTGMEDWPRKVPLSMNRKILDWQATLTSNSIKEAIRSRSRCPSRATRRERDGRRPEGAVRKRTTSTIASTPLTCWTVPRSTPRRRKSRGHCRLTFSLIPRRLWMMIRRQRRVSQASRHCWPHLRAPQISKYLQKWDKLKASSGIASKVTKRAQSKIKSRPGQTEVKEELQIQSDDRFNANQNSRRKFSFFNKTVDTFKRYEIATLKPFLPDL